ncbi:MAG: TIGR02757 family protein [Myxococcota bacterium]
MKERLFPPQPAAVLKATLDRFLAQTDVQPLIAHDPVQLVRAYADPEDQEVAGLLVAGLAYGRARSIRERAGAALALLGPHPARAIADPRRRRKLDGFVYRFQGGADLPRFLEAIAILRRARGSLARAFVDGVEPQDPDYLPALQRFARAVRGAIPGVPLTPGLRFLLPDGPGANKRLCLWLRWMVRGPDAVDLGSFGRLLPGELSPGRLVIPLDTHIERIGRFIGLTDRRGGGAQTARDITAALRAIRPDDPLAYDLALCHLGIAGACPRKRDLVRCQGCPIRGVCRLGTPPKGWR